MATEMTGFKKIIPREMRREGISIIEVLTSLAVATIGVFGVMVMIPFAVQQSQSGLDLDAAYVVGQNVIEELEINGFLSVETAASGSFLSGDICSYDPATGEATRVGGALDFYDYAVPQPLFLDPVRLSAPSESSGGSRTDLVVFPIEDLFPDAGHGPNDVFPPWLDINSVSLVSPDNSGGVGQPLSVAEANRLFKTRDDLVFGTEGAYTGELVDETAPPQQFFDISPTGLPTRRQAEGLVSWAYLLMPHKNGSFVPAPGTSTPVSAYNAFSFIYSNRAIFDVNNGLGPIDPESVSFVAEVARDNAAGSIGSGRVAGFFPAIRDIPLVNGRDVEASISKGDWVMLINRRPQPDPAGGVGSMSVASTTLPPVRYRAAETGYDIQVSFGRVIRVRNAVDTNNNNAYDLDVDAKPVITIDGGSFDFYNTDVANGLGLTYYPPPPVGLPQSDSSTYVVHLPNVVNVFQRVINVEY